MSGKICYDKNYPLNVWFDGRTHILRKGRDYNAGTGNFLVDLRKAAASQGVYLDGRARGNTVTLRAMRLPHQRDIA